MDKVNEVLGCTVAVRRLSPEKFHHPRDGRKWMITAYLRRSLLLELSTYANKDGSFICKGKNFSPSMENLQRFTARATLYRLLDDLKDLGLLSWVRPNHHERRVYEIPVIDLGSETEDEEEHVPPSETCSA